MKFFDGLFGFHDVTDSSQRWARQKTEWQADLTECGDVERQPGPSASCTSSSVWCFSTNTGRGVSTWDAFKDAAAQGYDVIMLQEYGLKQSELHALVRSASSRGYRSFEAESQERSKQAWGGAIMFAKKNLRARLVASSAVREYQSVTVMIEGAAFSCIYQPPDEPRLPLVEHLQEVQVLLPRGCHWLRTGDWNDEPEENFYYESFVDDGLEALAVCDENQKMLPTRWGGTRTLDYILSNSQGDVSRLDFYDGSFSDHKALQFEVLVQAKQEYKTLRLRSTDGLSFEASMPWKVWKQACDEWAQSSTKPTIPERAQNVSQQDVDRVWDKINLYYENMLRAAVLLCAFERLGPRKRKNRPKLVSNYPLFGKLDSSTAPFRLRKLRNLEAKLRELVGLEQRQKMHTQEAQNLQQKVLRNPLCPDGTWQQRLKQITVDLAKERQKEKQHRLHAWRQSLQNSNSLCYKWLKRGAPQVFKGLIAEKLQISEPVTLVSDALDVIKAHWQQVWDRTPVDSHEVWLHLQHQPGYQRWNLDEWPKLSTAECAASASKLRGKASGIDGWSGSEVASIPLEQWDVFCDFTQWIEAVGLSPSGWRQFKQCHIPKPSKIVRADGVCEVADLRPISISSSFYRVWASSRLRSQPAQEWMSTWWPEEAIGGKAKGEVFEALAPLAAAAAEKQFVATLDYSLAYDYCDPHLAVGIMKRLGLPEGIASLLSTTWGQQQRWLFFEGLVHQTSIDVSRSLPQGDPWSLAGLVATLKVPMQQISNQHPQMTARSFVDDRSWATPTAAETVEVMRKWHSWSDKLGLRENYSKTQFFAADQSCKQALLRNGVPEQQVSCYPCLLGTAFKGTARRKNTPKEEERLCKSQRLVRRASCLPVPYKRKVMIMAAAPFAKAAWGWFFKLPTKAQFRQFGATVRKALNEPKRACVHLRNILRGHRTDLPFRILEMNVMAARRCALKFPEGLPCTWDAQQGWSATIAQSLKQTGWEITAPWCWKHAQMNRYFSLDRNGRNFATDKGLLAHLLREAWRRSEWEAWHSSSRNDATACADQQYSERRCKLAREVAQSSYAAFGFLSGAFASPATIQRDETPCELCGREVPTTEHLLWSCPAFVSSRPRKPSDSLQGRLAWPVGLSTDAAVVSHCLEVRSAVLAARWKPSTTPVA